MRWATRASVHVDRAACAWLIRRFIDPDAEFVFVSDPDQVPPDATAFDMRGVELSHHRGDCTFETILRRYELTDPVLWRIGEIVLCRGLSMVASDEQVLSVTGVMFDGLYEHRRRAMLLGRDPA